MINLWIWSLSEIWTHGSNADLHSWTQGACVQRAAYLLDSIYPISRGRCGMLWLILGLFSCKIRISAFKSSHLLTHSSTSQKTKYNSSVSLLSFFSTEVKTSLTSALTWCGIGNEALSRSSKSVEWKPISNACSIQTLWMYNSYTFIEHFQK